MLCLPIVIPREKTKAAAAFRKAVAEEKTGEIKWRKVNPCCNTAFG